jgi:hypothetical protein
MEYNVKLTVSGDPKDCVRIDTCSAEDAARLAVYDYSYCHDEYTVDKAYVVVEEHGAYHIEGNRINWYHVVKE